MSSIDSLSEQKEARCLEIEGIVQGVGFRPFIYRLAGQYGLSGDVANNSAGVIIHVEGSSGAIDHFINDIEGECPSIARVIQVRQNIVKFKGMHKFVIRDSETGSPPATLISPDIAVCDDCLSELFDQGDRRYGYPFINCTNCGPRYTIIDDIPYDRPKTSMRNFIMCPACQGEYDNPMDRRFHAQPNACFDCGPGVSLFDAFGTRIDADNKIQHTAELLKQGAIVAIKGLGGFHLAADAVNSEVVAILRERKHREEKPLAVMAYGIADVKEFAHAGSEEEALLSSPECPIVILRKKESNPLAQGVSPFNNYFGVMLPCTPLHYLLLSHGFTALVMTSANLSEEPIAIDNDEAFKHLADIADYFLVHDRDIYLRSDDSIVKRTASEFRMMRRSRGYAPAPVFLKNRGPRILACGAELKNTVCLTKEDKAFLSQHIGDLENARAYDFFKLTIEHMKRILDIRPEIIAYDLHPDYLSTRYAVEQEGLQKIQVQHHHAHIVSCMAENNLDGHVMGLSFDGTGFGPDNTIWGGEVMVAGIEGFTRVGSLSCVPMPGSGAVIKEPWRMAVSYLYDAFGEDIHDLGIPMLNDIEKNNLKILIDMISKKVNSPLTSSLGRLFDGVASILGIRSHVSYEGQAAMELEMIAAENINRTYDYEWIEGDCYKILPGPIIRGVVKDLEDGVNISVISARFHFTLIRLFSDLCRIIRVSNGLERVVLSGGVFQNSIILSGLIKSLKKEGFKVFAHTKVPANDGGISLGQAVIASAITGH